MSRTRSGPLQPYSTLKQEAHDDSEISETASTGEDRSPLDNRDQGRNKFLHLSLVVNVIMLLVVLGLSLGPRALSPERKLLNSPVPECLSFRAPFTNDRVLRLTLRSTVVPYEIRTFKMDALFLSIPNEDSDRAWKDLPGRKLSCMQSQRLSGIQSAL